MTRAGYDPNDAVTALAEISIYLGDTSAGPFARLAALGKDHPITPDRIRHIRKLIASQSSR
jgi:Zn-dependent protease with chaperone function